MNPFTMRSKRLVSITVALACFIFLGCKKTTENFASASLSDYLPLQVGKYITYRLDSTVFTKFGTATELHSYQEKQIVDAEITDASGRTGYRILRYIRDAAGTQPWAPRGAYFIVPNSKTIEVVDNNLRFLKLASPIKKDFTWKGNEYLNNDPFVSSYSFSNDDDMSDWEYVYTNLNDSFSYNQQNLPNVIKVLQKDERVQLDTVTINNNAATIPLNSQKVWLVGLATDTIMVKASTPSIGNEELTIYNQTNGYISFNGIKVPNGFGFTFEYANGKWGYPNTLTVANNKVSVPSYAFQAYITGHATDTINVDVSGINTFQIDKISIYNRSDTVARCNFNPTLNKFLIPKGSGRTYEFYQGKWRLLGDDDVLLTTDPFFDNLPYGKNTYAFEKYAKRIGLVYQEFDMWEYQPPNAANITGARTGFEVRRTMIDHN